MFFGFNFSLNEALDLIPISYDTILSIIEEERKKNQHLTN